MNVLAAIEEYVKVCIEYAIDAEEPSTDMRDDFTRAQDAAEIQIRKAKIYQRMLVELAEWKAKDDDR